MRASAKTNRIDSDLQFQIMKKEIIEGAGYRSRPIADMFLIYKGELLSLSVDDDSSPESHSFLHLKMN